MKVRNLVVGAIMFSSAFAFADIGLFGSKQPLKVEGVAMHFYEKDDSKLVNLTKALHEKFGLFIAQYQDHLGTYFGPHNMKAFETDVADVTAYSELGFSKSSNGYRLHYQPHKGASTNFIELGSVYNKEIDALFAEIMESADFVSLKGVGDYGRGGSHLSAKNLSEPYSVTLICKKTIYKDGSGGTDCKTQTSEIDFAQASIKVFVEGSKRIEVPKKFLKTWQSDYWNGKL